MYSASFHSHTRTYRINSVIVRFDCNLCPFSRLTNGIANCNQAVVNLRNFLFKQLFQKDWRHSRQNDVWYSVFHLDLEDHCFNCITFAEKVSRDLLALWKNNLHPVFVHQQHFFLPCLIYFADYYLSNFFFVLGKYACTLIFLHLTDQILSDCENVSSTEIF